jgi:hypothetical protein
VRPATEVRLTTWDKSDLERRLCRVLDVADECVERLASRGYSDSKEPANNLRPEKLISETAVLLYAASTSIADRGPEVAAKIDCVARKLIPFARSERMLIGVCLEPSLALDFSEAHICLNKLGYTDSGFDELLRQSRNSQAAPGRERVPHRVLQQSWICDVWAESTSTPGNRVPSFAVKSVLSNPIDLLRGARSDIYAFTHALMYLRGFNVSPRRLPRPRHVILEEAEVALAWCLDEQDYDLGGEVLLAWPLTGRSWSAAATFGFSVLAHVEDKNGILPASSTRSDRMSELGGDYRANYFMATAYHTAYVMGLLCGVALQSDRTPPAKIPTQGAGNDRTKEILRILDADEKLPHWRDELESLSHAEREALAGFLFNIALCRKIRRGEFGEAHDLLRLGYALGLADTPAGSQTAELLARLATFAEITGGRGSASGEN